MNRIFVITNSTFPFGNANSNYLRYFALSLRERGWQVLVIGSHMNGGENKGEYRGISFVNLPLPRVHLPFHLREHFGYGGILKKELQKAGIESGDYVFVYSMYRDLLKTVLRATEHLQPGHRSIAMVEWFQPFQYRFGKANPDYLCWRYSFETIAPRFGKILPISEHLASYYQEKGCDTLILPIMADSRENRRDRERLSDGLCHWIYPGDIGKKDTLDGLFLALGSLPCEQAARVRIHFTFFSREKAEQCMARLGLDREKILPLLIFHGKLSYEDLLQLYKTVDFLPILREKNTVTLSNFPSKIPELMCYGVIPVCSAVGEYTRYLTDGTDSFLAEGAGQEACLSLLKRCLSLNEMQLENMRRSAEKTARERFDYTVWAETIEAFLLSESHQS